MPADFTTRSTVQGRRGVIATSNYLATEAGMHILRQGGNCVDAIIAAAAVLNVVEPHCSHLGGDAFLIFHDGASGQVTAINSSGVAPAGLTPDLFGTTIPPRGFLSSTIPGEVAAWDAALTRFGTMQPDQLLAEAIYYAERGFPVSRNLAGALDSAADMMAQFPSTAAVFMREGRALASGEILRQPDLAQTLKRLVYPGFRDFYEGETAERIADFWQQSGGVISADDLAAHEARVLEPLQTTYRGYTIYEQPPVSQGHILLQSLNMVDTFDLAAMGHLSAEAMHVCIEANKLAHADKDRYTTDPRFSPLPEGLLSRQYAADRAMLIDMHQAMTFAPPPGSPPGAADTTYLCCADGRGNAVSYIQSLFHGFGCGVVAEGTGVLLNNRACGFSLDPTHVNYLVPGKKTVHTLNTYMIFRDGRPVVVGGTPGGDVQVQTNLQVITGLLDFGRDPQQAAEDPRWTRHDARNISLEARAPKKTFEGLQERGHPVDRIGPYAHGGRVQVIRIEDDGVLVGGSDPRCDGCALAF
jgi:gamma-glutamyltranspeptidase/glutathione hydrolase